MSELNQWEQSIVDHLRYGSRHNQSVTLGADEVHIPMNAIIARGNRRAQPENKPLTHGRWVYHTDDWTPAKRCDVCGYSERLIANGDQRAGAYCPRCGAKMDKEGAE